MTKIVFISDTFYPEINGVAVFLKIIMPELVKQGYEITLFTNLKTKDPFNNPKIKIIRLRSVELQSYSDVWMCIPNPVTFTRLLLNEKPDIIHFHTPHSPLSILALLIAKYRKIPTVATFHGFLDKYHKYLHLFKSANIGHYSKKILKIVPLFRNLRVLSMKKKAIWKALEIIFNRFDRVIVPSELSAKKVRRHNIACIVVPWGIDLYTFIKKKDYNRTRKVLYVGRLGFEKNVACLVNAMSQLKNKTIKLTIIGDGPARQDLEMLAKRLHLDKKITFQGFVNREKLQDYFLLHDFFVNPSDSETFGFATIEAMAAGLPIIGVRSHGTADMVKHNVNGILVKPNNAKELAKSIDLMSCSENLEKMGNESYRLAQHFSVSKCIKKHAKIYNKLLERGKKQKLE